MRESGERETRAATVADAPGVLEIYNHYVAETVITFEEEPVVLGEMERRIAGALGELPFLVTVSGASVLAFACATPWKSRAAYRHTVESAIYVHPDFTGRGLGRPLYEELLRQLQASGCRAVLGGIALPNEASIALHERCGFIAVGRLEQVGHKFGRWIDVGYWQRLFEHG